MPKFYKFRGIGGASASIIMAGLASNPATVFLTQGFVGKLVFLFFKFICMVLASFGLIVLNVGAAKLETVLAEEDYDGSYESAERIIKKIREQGRELTDEEIKAIDTPVIDAFRKFAGFGRVRKRRDSGLQSTHNTSSER